METSCLFKKTFATVEELDAFVNYFQLVRGVELRWNRMERTVWLHCDQSMHEELSTVCSCDGSQPTEA